MHLSAKTIDLLDEYVPLLVWVKTFNFEALHIYVSQTSVQSSDRKKDLFGCIVLMFLQYHFRKKMHAYV